MQNTGPARLYALVFGSVLVVAGIIGFFYSSAFGDPGEVDAVLGILDVNGWHNVVHILTGALGLAAFASGANAARTYAFGSTGCSSSSAAVAGSRGASARSSAGLSDTFRRL
jgi:uncharacterized protein DUF4383